MRLAVSVLLLALPVGGCAIPTYSDPPLAAKIDRQRNVRDNCLLAHAPQIDDGRSDVRGVARTVAAACSGETERLLELAVPYAGDHARDGFRQEAERRAADIVLTFRRVDPRSDVREGVPTPLVR